MAYKDKEKRRENARRYREANREKVRKYARDYNRRNRKKIAEKQRQRIKANPEKYREHGKRWREKNQDKIRCKMFRMAYGITLKQYEKMLQVQDHRCALCWRPIKGARAEKFAPAVDHDHKTGRIRAILHQQCNRLLGQADDEPVILRAAIRYLERDKEPPRCHMAW